VSDASRLREQLLSCQLGHAGWRQFEDACIAILTYLFVPPLNAPKIQARTYSNIDRRDAVFPNRNSSGDGNWSHLYRELNARLILFEFKNYDVEEVGKEETNQTRNYLTRPMGRLAVLCCRRRPNAAAHRKRNTIFSEEGKVILFLTPDHLLEMLLIKERGEDPSDLWPGPR
jgi:hypothetical protein